MLATETSAQQGSQERIRVLIADDHPLFRQGLRMALEMSEDIRVVGEAGTGRQCLDMVRSLRPDVVLIDINMPDINGLEVCRTLKEQSDGPGIVILTIHDEEEYLLEAVRLGVEGYVLKDVEPSMLVQAIRASRVGQPFLQPNLASRLMAGVRRREAEQRRISRPEEVLTAREIEVLNLLAEGACNKEIADRLYISEKTVKNHTNSIFRKMGVSDRTQAVLEAIRKGWVQVR